MGDHGPARKGHYSRPFRSHILQNQPEKMDTKEYGNMLQPILIPKGERVPAKNARGWDKKCQKADEQAQEGAWLDGGDMAQVRAITIQHERDEVCAALQYADSVHCLTEE